MEMFSHLQLQHKKFICIPATRGDYAVIKQVSKTKPLVETMLWLSQAGESAAICSLVSSVHHGLPCSSLQPCDNMPLNFLWPWRERKKEMKERRKREQVFEWRGIYLKCRQCKTLVWISSLFLTSLACRSEARSVLSSGCMSMQWEVPLMKMARSLFTPVPLCVTLSSYQGSIFPGLGQKTQRASVWHQHC